MARKYLVFPGRVVSRTDGQEHHVRAGNLMRLYGVHPDECHIARDGVGLWGMDLVELRPRGNGDYSLERAEARHEAARERGTFYDQILREIAKGMGVPLKMLVKDYGKGETH